LGDRGRFFDETTLSRFDRRGIRGGKSRQD
jgi:hypothetical protein